LYPEIVPDPIISPEFDNRLRYGVLIVDSWSNTYLKLDLLITVGSAFSG
jgi:hypothetical protein